MCPGLSHQPALLTLLRSEVRRPQRVCPDRGGVGRVAWELCCIPRLVSWLRQVGPAAGGRGSCCFCCCTHPSRAGSKQGTGRLPAQAEPPWDWSSRAQAVRSRGGGAFLLQSSSQSHAGGLGAWLAQVLRAPERLSGVHPTPVHILGIHPLPPRQPGLGRHVGMASRQQL